MVGWFLLCQKSNAICSVKCSSPSAKFSGQVEAPLSPSPRLKLILFPDATPTVHATFGMATNAANHTNEQDAAPSTSNAVLCALGDLRCICPVRSICQRRQHPLYENNMLYSYMHSHVNFTRKHDGPTLGPSPANLTGSFHHRVMRIGTFPGLCK